MFAGHGYHIEQVNGRDKDSIHARIIINCYSSNETCVAGKVYGVYTISVTPLEDETIVQISLMTQNKTEIICHFFAKIGTP